MRRSTSRAIAQPQRNVARIALFAAGALLLALLSLAITVAMVFQRTQPGLARAWWPWGAQARAEIAVMTAQEAVADAASVKPDALARANARARLALAREPVNVAAARALGLLYAAGGRDGAARASFAYSEALSRRDLSTQLWLIEDRVAAGDVPGAMRHYDRALRTSREAYDVLIPVLIQASAQPDVARELARLMAPRPDWWLALTDTLVTTGPSAPAIAQVMRAVRLDPGRPIDRDLTVAGLRRLAEMGDAAGAYAVYREIAARAGWSVAPVNDGGFDAVDDLPPFGWTLADTPQASASKQALDDDPANPVLQLSVEDGAQGELASQTLLLGPGSYRLTARTGGVEAGAVARPVLSLLCPNGAVVGGAALTGGQGQIGFAFAVPRGCTAQRLSIALPTAADAPVSAWIDSIAIARAGAAKLMLDYALFIALFVAECMTLRWAIGRGGLIPFPVGTMGYIVCGQTVLMLHAKGVMDYDFLRIYTTYAYIYHLRSILLLLAAIFFALTLCIPKTRISIGEQLQSLVVRDALLWAIVLVVAVADIYLFTQFDWSVLWSNRIYLTMAGDSALRQPDPLSTTVFLIHPLLGLGIIVTCIYAYSTGRVAVLAGSLPFALWHLLFAIASHSRYAVAYLLIAALLVAILSKRRGTAVILVIVGVLTQVSVLAGRNSGHHGFSSLTEFVPNMLAYFGENPTGAISNFFEGAFVTSEYFGRTLHYATIYKVLSLSPLISAIDGFGAIRASYEIRLHEYVPVSAISEVLSFGAGYALVFFGVELIAGKLSADLMSRRPGVVPLALNAAVFLGSYLQFTYSARSIFRFFFFTALICFILGRIAASQERRRPVPLRGAAATEAPAPRRVRRRRFVAQ